MTGNDIISCHHYQVERAKKVYTVYELVEVIQTNNITGLINRSDKSNTFKKGIQFSQLTDLIRIEDFRKYSNGNGFDKYLRLRNTNNWSKCEQVTGLYFTENKNLFFGDRLHGGRRNLIVFHFNDDRSKVTIDYYIGYYPSKEVLRQLLNKYN